MGQSILAVMSQTEGIKDLPTAACRLYFAKAVLSEKRGDHEAAEEFLDKAVRAETFAGENK